MSPLLPQECASIFCGGILSDHRLDHPEGVCVDPRDGSLWCGGEGGQIYHISPDGLFVREVMCTGGFILGLAFDALRNRIYLCDLAHRCVWDFDPSVGNARRIECVDGAERLRLPNFPALSPDGQFLYVSDTRRNGGPGIWRIELDSGVTRLWMQDTCLSANGLCVSPDGHFLFLVESYLPGVSRVPILPGGTAGRKELLLALPGMVPDGLAYSSCGDLWISIYDPTCILRYRLSDQRLDCIIADDTTDVLHHSTNIAFRGADELFVANLGGWHLTKVDLASLSR